MRIATCRGVTVLWLFAGGMWSSSSSASPTRFTIYDPAVGAYGTALRNAIRPAMDAFAANAHFGLVNDTHGEILSVDQALRRIEQVTLDDVHRVAERVLSQPMTLTV